MQKIIAFAAFLAALLLTTTATAATIEQTREFTFTYGFDLFDIPPEGTDGTGLESAGDGANVFFDKFDPAVGLLTGIRLTHRFDPLYEGRFANTYGRSTSNTVEVNIASEVNSGFVGLGLPVLAGETPAMVTGLVLFDEGGPGIDPPITRTPFSENGPVSEFAVDLGSLPGFDSSGFLAILDLAPVEYFFEGIVARSVTVIPPNPCTTDTALFCSPELSSTLELRNSITLAYEFTPRGTVPVPEPATGALLFSALLGLGLKSRRRH